MPGSFPPAKESGSHSIGRAIRYPLAAQVQGLEGTSLVTFRIMAEGTVDEIRIVKSSDYEILDEAALKTVRRAAPFPALPEAIKEPHIQLNIPLVFEFK